MCSMDKCNLKEKRNGNGTAILGFGVFAAQSKGNICALLRNYLKRFNVPGINYVCQAANTGLYIYHPATRYLREVSQQTMSSYCLHHRVKFVEISSCCKLAYDPHPNEWKSQSLIGSMTSSVEKMISYFTALQNNVKMAASLDFRLLLIDILALIIEVRDGFLTFGKFFSILLRLYTTYKRFHHMAPQSLGTSDLLVGFTLLGLPLTIIDRMKTFTALTGQRIFDADLISSLLSKFFLLVRDIVSHFENNTILGGPCAHVLTFLDWCGSNFFDYSLMTEVAAIYTEWVRTPQIIFDPSFRERVTLQYEKCVASHTFIAYADNTKNKHFNVTWTLFKESLLKSIKAFESSRRKEPICFVFEGAAGSGKSTLMNNFVDLLRMAGKSVYCHTVPSTEDAKDFYDDYENQEVFVMDDVGQQGKSQWRTIINFVSPVKYPLPCATASKKNTKFFNSEIILCTTNHLMDLSGFTSSDCITEPEALKRRIHLIKVINTSSPQTPFTQELTYHKFDHRVHHTWRKELLHHCARDDIPVSYEGDNIADSLHWLYVLFKHIERRENENRGETTLPAAFFNRIIEKAEAFDYQSLFGDAWQGLHNGGLIFKEWISSLFDTITAYMGWLSTNLQKVVTSIISGNMTLEITMPSFLDRDESVVSISVGSLLAMSLTIMGVIYLLYTYLSSEDTDENAHQSTVETAFRKAAAFAHDMDEYNRSQEVIWLRMGVNPDFKAESQQRIENVAKFLKTIIIKKNQHDRCLDEELQCVVSGKYILLPAHVDCQSARVDLYHSYEHFKNKHVEMENVDIKLVKSFYSCDLAVYEMVGPIPLYKKCWNLFSESSEKNPNMYIGNSIGYFPVVLGATVRPNDEQVRYSRFMQNGKTTFDHAPASGLLTPLSAEGMCGTVIISASHGIIGYHVAGNDTNGFCVIPSKTVATEIRNIMLTGPESKFDIDDKVIPNCSGARLRYQAGQVEVARSLASTSFVPTVFHAEYNSDVAALCSGITQEHTIAPLEPVGKKIPPIFGEHPRKLLADISKKTFKRQGFITGEERQFISKVMEHMLIPYDDVTDQECAFGGEFVGALNKDSSNGYGCLQGKDKYFDFENKEILSPMHELIQSISSEAKTGDYDYNHFMSRETFKDELRKEEKADTPRTFRVMPLGHIWWTKKIFGKLIAHFRTNMHEFGCCVGLNPYMDFGEIYRRLKQCPVTGDIDFKQWDGSVMSDIMMTIFDEMAKKYTGPNKAELEYVARTSTYSFVLVGDAVWATTHGLPSGTWLTLLINCLINKAITALTLYRNKPNCQVDDIFEVVDYVMGDDKIFGAPRGYESFFNLRTINETAVSLGMTCTNGDKTPITKEHQPLDKLTFVKRHMREHPQLQRIVGVLSLETILNTLQWYDSSKDIEQVMEGKMRAVQVEAYLHSKLLFQQLTDIMAKSYPFTPLFDEKQVIKILRDREAYIQVMAWLGKDMRFIEGGTLNNPC